MSKAIEKFAESAGGPIGVAIAVLGVAAVVWSVWGKKVKEAAAAVKEAAAAVGTRVNPASDKNLVYNGVVGGLGRAISGDDHWSLGGWVYEMTHKQYDPNATYTPRSIAVKEEAGWYERLLGN